MQREREDIPKGKEMPILMPNWRYRNGSSMVGIGLCGTRYQTDAVRATLGLTTL